MTDASINGTRGYIDNGEPARLILVELYFWRGLFYCLGESTRMPRLKALKFFYTLLNLIFEISRFS